MAWLRLLLTLAVASLGVAFARKLKMPVAPMVGSILAVGCLQIGTGQAYMPNTVQMLTQIINGAFIGSMIGYEDVLRLKNLIAPSVVNAAAMLAYGVLMSFAVIYFAHCSQITALFACAPGGLTDMTLIGHDLGADVGVVAVMQLSRVLFAMAVLPFVLKWVLHRFHVQEGQGQQAADDGKKREVHTNRQLMITLLVGLIGGLIGHLSGVPAGRLIFAMIACTTFNVITRQGYMPRWVKLCAQTLAGTLIGSSLTLESVIQMRLLCIPIIALALGYLLLDFLLTFVLVKFLHVNLQTALFACAPGGMADMALMAADFGANMVSVVSIQMVRMCGTILLYPVLVQWIAF